MLCAQSLLDGHFWQSGVHPCTDDASTILVAHVEEHRRRGGYRPDGDLEGGIQVGHAQKLDVKREDVLQPLWGPRCVPGILEVADQVGIVDMAMSIDVGEPWLAQVPERTVIGLTTQVF